MRPKSPKRNGALGMNAPGAQYDPNTIAQMQAAIDNLAGQVRGLTEQRNNLEAKIVAMQASGAPSSSSGERQGDGGATAGVVRRDDYIDNSSEDSVPETAVLPSDFAPRDVVSDGGPSAGVGTRFARSDHVHYYAPIWVPYNGD